MYKIEKGIPLRAQSNGAPEIYNVLDALVLADIGDSVLFPKADGYTNAKKIIYAAQNVERRLSRKIFAIRTGPDGIRVWRKF
jgi:hypothetical protein